LVGRERLDTAFAFDALQLEFFFVTGPLLVVAIAGATSPAAAFLTAALMHATGAVAFAVAPASRGWRPAAREGRTLASALSRPSMRVLVVALAIAGVSIGALEIGIPASPSARGRAPTPDGSSLSGRPARSPAGSGTARGPGACQPLGASCS
jgi:hypothetical protein